MKKVFPILKAIYNFEPIIFTTDLNRSQIYALKNCKIFNKKPFIIWCFFHYEQRIIKHFKKFNIINKNMNNHAYVILRNFQILSFFDKKILKIILNF